MKMIAWFAAALLCSSALAQTSPAAPTQRLRGTVESFDGSSLVIAERSGEKIALVLADNFSISEVVPVDVGMIRAGAYIGTAAMPAPDGTLNALEVLLFPEAARGTAEGHSAWDLQPGSTMTNATVAEVVSAAQGRTLKLRYKDGEKTVVVPDNVPIVTFKPGDRSLLVKGAKVLVTSQMRDGKPTALRAIAGRDGFGPPM
jgi:hypothetical protein